MKKHYNGIIWDYNGTLIDDVHTALASVNDMLIKRGMRTITLADYYSYLDTPIIKFYAHLFDFKEVPFEVLAKEFAQGYARHIPQNPLMKHADAALSFAQKRGVCQMILSASNQQQIDAMAKQLNIDRYFTCISGAKDFNAESKLDRGRYMMRRCGLHPEQTLIIGDALHDYDVAKALHADCILFSKGHQSKVDLSRAGVPVIDDLAELYAIIE